MMVNEGYREGADITKTKFIGKPLKRLYQRHGVSRGGYALLLETEGGRTRIGGDVNLSVLILKNKQYADYPVLDIVRYYDEIHVIITRSEEYGHI